MIFGSVCSGIEAASAAWKPFGWHCAFMSEIDAFPRAVLKHHYSETPLHGDFTTIQAGEYEPINVLVGGTPCQSFSVAGLRGGMADARGNLALEYLLLAERLRPRWIVWENVPGVLSSNDGRDFGSFVGGMGQLGYGWAYRSFDAQYFQLAQRRERVFVVGCLGDWRRAAAVLFEPASLRGDPAPSRETRERVAGTIAARTRGGGGRGTDFDLDGGLRVASRGSVAHEVMAIQERAVCDNPNAGPDGVGVRTDGLAYTLEARTVPQAVAYGGNNTAGPIDVATAVNAHGGPHGRLDFESETFISDVAPSLTKQPHLDGQSGRNGMFVVTHSLRADGFDASEDGTGRGDGKPGQGYPAVQSGAAVRRLTPRECARLQGFPDDYLDITYRGKPAADGNKYKALGNSMAVPVMAWIGRRIAVVDREKT